VHWLAVRDKERPRFEAAGHFSETGAEPATPTPHTGHLRAAQESFGHAYPRMTAKYEHVVDMARKTRSLFILVKVG
jgi:hypothetical protein